MATICAPVWSSRAAVSCASASERCTPFTVGCFCSHERPACAAAQASIMQAPSARVLMAVAFIA